MTTTTDVNPAISADSGITDFTEIFSGRDRAEFYFGQINRERVVEGMVDSSHKKTHTVVESARTIIIAMLSAQIPEGCMSQSEIEGYKNFALRHFDRFWSVHKNKNFGFVVDTKNHHMYLKIFDSRLSEQDVLDNKFTGQTVFFAKFESNELMRHFIEYVCLACGCDTWAKEVCPIYGFRQICPQE